MNEKKPQMRPNANTAGKRASSAPRQNTPRRKKNNAPDVRIIAAVVAAVLIAVIVMIAVGCSKDDAIGTPKDTLDTAESTSNLPDTAKPVTEPPKPDTTVPETEPPVTAPAGATVTDISLDRYSVRIAAGSKEMPMVTMYPENAENKNEIWQSDNTSVATVNKYGNIYGVAEGTCTVTVTSEDNPTVFAKVAVTVYNDPSVKTPTYINGILIANKTYALPSDYNPGVDPEAESALYEMFAAAKNDGISLWIASGFRSYQRQTTLYNNYVAKDGKAAADRYSARPGHSEHQTGLAFDLNSLEQSFGNTPEGRWIAANSWKYGYIIRYPEDTEAITGYMYEPWHVRYIGKDNAKAVFESGLCLEEYLGITSVYSED